MGVGERTATGKLRDLAGKLTLPQMMNGNDMTQTVTLAERQDALQHDKHSWTWLTRRKQARTARVMPDSAKAPDTRDLRRAQHRKELMAPARESARQILARYLVTQRRAPNRRLSRHTSFTSSSS